MAKKFYVPINHISKEVKKMYVPVNGVSKKITKAYCSVNGLSKQFWGDEEILKTWIRKTWYGIDAGAYIRGDNVWSDGTNIYLSNSWDYGTSQEYVLDKLTSTWSKKTWNGDVPSIKGSAIWSDGNNIYYDYGNYSRVLDKNTSTWNNNAWNYSAGTASQRIRGDRIWTDGTNIYHSYGAGYSNLILNKATKTWSEITFNGFNDIYGNCVWSDGTNTYYSNYSSGELQYVFDKNTNTWSPKTWYGMPSGYLYGYYIWREKGNVYSSFGNKQYTLDKSTSTWSQMSWIGLTGFSGSYIWSDGSNTYLSDAINSQYVLT